MRTRTRNGGGKGEGEGVVEGSRWALACPAQWGRAPHKVIRQRISCSHVAGRARRGNM